MKLFHDTDQELTFLETRIIKYIEENTKEFLTMGVVDVAKKTFVSTPMISKFVKRRGFTNFKAMQIYISSEFAKYSSLYADPGEKNIKILSRNIAGYLKYGIDKTVDSFDDVDISAAIALIWNAEDIYIYGSGSSKFAADNTTKKLRILNKDTKTITSIEDIKLWGNPSIKEKTLLIIYSHSMTSDGIKALLDFSIANKIFVIVITANEKIKSSNRLLKIQIKTSESDVPIAISWFSPKISLLLTSDVLIESLRSNYGLKEKEKFK